MRSLPALALLVLAVRAAAATYTLDDPASPVRVVFDTNGGRLTVTKKSDNFVWKSPDTGGGSTVTVGTVTQPSDLTLTANATFGGQALTLTWTLTPATGELAFRLDGTGASLGGGLVYPHPFLPVDGSGFAVLPADSGYVVPTTATTFSSQFGQRGMEWFGGTDASNTRAWMALVDTPDDYDLRARTGNVAGLSRLGAAANWRGSNANPGRTAGLVSYARTLRFRFLDAGGYVALAKVFRQSAAERGWLSTFAQKQAANPALDLSRFLGAPICYLWGDGRSTALLDAMSNAGLQRAVIQLSINHADQQKVFPASGLEGTAWFNAVRAKGWFGGFYDIYAATRTGGQGGTPYDGFYYLWPSVAYNDWAIILSTGQPDTTHTISAQMAASFAAGTRLPAHLNVFNPDAVFFDVVCAVDLQEDYDTSHGHSATRSVDQVNRAALLNSAFSNPTRRLLTGTEQGRSWAVPFIHWGEGKFRLGSLGQSSSDGSFNDNTYPSIMSDVVDPVAAGILAQVLDDNYAAPLWDLVFHDCVVMTQHWHRPHNKYLYAWDHADRWALLRGQAPLLNLTYDGVRGLASRQPNQLTDADGASWSTRWTVMGSRFAQTFQTVCAWHAQVGAMEMIDARRLTTDRTVQMTEFSSDGGLSGRGIVVNFGAYDGVRGVAGTTWSGALRGQSLSVPVASTQAYAWEARPQAVMVDRPAAGTVRVRFTGLNDARIAYRIQRSTDLSAWSDAGVPVAAGSAFEFSETLAVAEVFYRVVTQVQ